MSGEPQMRARPVRCPMCLYERVCAVLVEPYSEDDWRMMRALIAVPGSAGDHQWFCPECRHQWSDS